MTTIADRVIVQGQGLEFSVRLQSINYTLGKLYGVETKDGHYVLMEERGISTKPFGAVDIEKGDSEKAKVDASSRLLQRANELAQQENKARGYSETASLSSS